MSVRIEAKLTINDVKRIFAQGEREAREEFREEMQREERFDEAIRRWTEERDEA